MVTVPTPDGGRLELTPVGALVDVRVMDSEGRTLATVAKPPHEVALLLAASGDASAVRELARHQRSVPANWPKCTGS